MGGSSSKPPPPPEIDVEHRNQLQSPTSNTVSSGFHMLELHGQTMTTVLTVLICAAIWAVMTWKAGMWRIRRRTKKEQKWREEMDRMEGGPHLLPMYHHPHQARTAEGRFLRSWGTGDQVQPEAWKAWQPPRPIYPAPVLPQVPLGTQLPSTAAVPELKAPQEDTMRAILPIMTALADRAKNAEDMKRAKGRFVEVSEARRHGPRPGTGTRTSDKTLDTEVLITSEEEGILPRQTIQRMQRR